MNVVQTPDKLQSKTLGTIEESGSGSETIDKSTQELLPRSNRNENDGVKDEEEDEEQG